MLGNFTYLLQPLKHTAFRWLWFGQFLNVAGDAVFGVALSLALLYRAHPAKDMGVVLGTVSIGMVASLIYGGVLADRFRKSRVLIISDVLRVTGVLGIILLGAEAPLLILSAFGLLIGVGEGMYRPTYAALIPEVIDEQDIRAASGLRSATNRLAAIVGAALGGILASAASPNFALWIDVVTFAISIVILIFIHDSVQPGREEESVVGAAISGLSYVFHKPWMSAVMLQGMLQVAFVVAPVALLLPLILGKAHPELYGIALSLEALGAFLGSLAGASFSSKRPGLLAMIALMLQAPQLIILATGSHVWLLVPFGFLTGFGLSVFGVIWTTSLQITTPREKLGRVLAIDALANSAVTPLGLIATGNLLPIMGYEVVAWTAEGVLLVSILGALTIPGVIQLGGSGTADSTLSENHGKSQ